MFSTQSSQPSQLSQTSQTSRRVSFIRQGFMEMAPVPLSPHAEVRQQQRGIRRDVYAVIDSDGYVVTTGQPGSDAVLRRHRPSTTPMNNH